MFSLHYFHFKQVNIHFGTHIVSHFFQNYHASCPIFFYRLDDHVVVIATGTTIITRWLYSRGLSSTVITGLLLHIS